MASFWPARYCTFNDCFRVRRAVLPAVNSFINPMLSSLAPQVGLRHDQQFPDVFALLCILLKILPGWGFTPFTLSSLQAPRCALVVTGMKTRYRLSHFISCSNIPWLKTCQADPQMKYVFLYISRSRHSLF